jgi:hypothetical protein
MALQLTQQDQIYVEQEHVCREATEQPHRFTGKSYQLNEGKQPTCNEMTPPTVWNTAVWNQREFMA